MAERLGVELTPEAADQDRYPNIHDVLVTIQHAEDLPNGPVEKLEVNCFATGEATYRITLPRSEEPTGGYLPEV